MTEVVTALKRLSVRVEAFRRAMDATMAGTTPDHAKWGAYRAYAETYNDLARRYQALTQEPVGIFPIDRMKGSNDTLWPNQKEVFDRVYAQVMMLSADLSGFDTGISASISNVEDLLSANLRKIIYARPEREVDVQNAVESLLVGRGYNKGVSYDREAGKIKFSGKEFIPDFIFQGLNLALEIKLIRDKDGLSKCIEEMSADIPSYLSSYDNVLFCVYDLGAIRDVHEFQSGISKQVGVRICVVKH